MHKIIESHKVAFNKAIDHLKHELQQIRGNRAHASMIEDIKVEAYGGSRMALKELGSITVPEQRQLVFQPWDKNVLKEVERILLASNLNAGIANDGEVLRLTLPTLTNETRQQLLKILSQKLEQARVQIRQVREDVRTELSNAEKAKEISEDEKFSAQEDVEEVVKDYSEQIKTLGDNKEKEITTV
jgi:ribosome recycling factor